MALLLSTSAISQPELSIMASFGQEISFLLKKAGERSRTEQKDKKTPGAMTIIPKQDL